MCHMSHVKCLVSRVTCHVSHVFFSSKEIGQCGGASRWRVCYQRGLSRLVYRKIALNHLQVDIWILVHYSTPLLETGWHCLCPGRVRKPPKRWNRIGVVVEVQDHEKYVVKINESGRATTRNRKYSKPITSYEEIFTPSKKVLPLLREERLQEHNSSPSA